MKEFLDKYISYLQVERDSSPFTVRNYSIDIHGFFDFLKSGGVGSLQDIDHFTVRRYLSWLLEKGIVRASISRKMSALRSFFRYLSQQELVSLNPMSKVAGQKGEKRLPSFLTSEETLRLLQAPDISTPQGIRDLAILEMLYAAGLRVSEITSLQVTNVDLQTRQIRVWGKGSKERIVLIGEPAARALEQYLKFGRIKLLGRTETDALFVNRYGQRIAERRIQYLIKKYAEQARISGRVFPHMLRHTFATHMLDGGADLRVVQELLGHANLSTTQIYTHITHGQMRGRYLEAHPRSKIDKRAVRTRPTP